MKKILFLSLIFGLTQVFSQSIKVFSDFENGNVDIYQIDTINNKIEFTPGKDLNNTLRCWFFFGIANAKNKTITIEEKNSSKIYVPRFPVFSYDKKNWQRVTQSETSEFGRIFKIFSEGDTIYFAMGFPYTYSDLLEFLDSVAGNRFVQTDTLCLSEKQNPVFYLTIRNKEYKQENAILIIARQHAFESLSNYVLEGMIWAFADTSSSEMREFLKKTLVVIVPMMDVDNVISGQSGRLQKPIDFNRDWTTTPHWNAIKAVQKLADSLNRNFKLRLFFDLHSTFPGGKTYFTSYLNFYKPFKPSWINLHQFFMQFNKNSKFTIKEYFTKYEPNVFYADNYFSNLITDPAFPHFPYMEFAITIEFDWNKINDQKLWTQENLRQLGKDLAKTIAVYSEKW